MGRHGECKEPTPGSTDECMQSRSDDPAGGVDDGGDDGLLGAGPGRETIICCIFTLPTKTVAFGMCLLECFIMTSLF